MLTAFFCNFLSSSSNSKQHEEELTMASAVQALYAAIFAHENFKHRLQTFVEGTSKEVFTSQEVYFADRSELGKWLLSVGKTKFAHISAFASLVEHQKMFHFAAANVVSQLEAGKKDEAAFMLAGQFEHFSDAIIADLLRLRDAVEVNRKAVKRI